MYTIRWLTTPNITQQRQSEGYTSQNRFDRQPYKFSPRWGKPEALRPKPLILGSELGEVPRHPWTLHPAPGILTPDMSDVKSSLSLWGGDVVSDLGSRLGLIEIEVLGVLVLLMLAADGVSGARGVEVFIWLGIAGNANAALRDRNNAQNRCVV